MAVSCLALLGFFLVGVAAQNPEGRRAAAWLLLQRHPDGGWDAGMTPWTVLSLRLAEGGGGDIEAWSGTEAILASKQLELDLVLMLWRHHESPVAPGTLAQYTLALLTLCKDVRNFHGHDLINMLQHHEAELDYDYALSSLTICSSGHNVRRRQIRRLTDVAERSSSHNVDTLAMVLLALDCSIPDHHHRNLGQYARRIAQGLAARQLPDGSFGNTRSTALAIQALDSGDNESAAMWNRSSAVASILAAQATDGSFGENVGITADALLGLSPRGLGSMRDIGCTPKAPSVINSFPPSATSSVQVGVDFTNITLDQNVPKESAEVSVTYSVWVGTNVTENYTLTVKTEHNSTFYTVMMLAAQQDKHFEFEATEWPNGHYVHTLAGHKEEPGSYLFWLLYQTPQMPDPISPPGNQLITPVGVDGLLVDEGDHYLFWYKKL